MRIVVCIKAIAASKINRRDIDDEYKVGTKDMYALKTALAIKKKYPADIDVVCMAPLHFYDVLRNLYIYDINKIYLATDSLLAGADTFVTSLVLCRMIERIGMADIILCGKSSDDSGTAQIGPSLAERLNYQLISDISAIEVNGRCINLESNLENIKYEIEAELPMVGIINRPPANNEYPSLRNLRKQKKDITIFNAEDLKISEGQIQSKTKVLRLFSYEEDKKGKFIQGDIFDKATRFIDVIRMYN